MMSSQRDVETLGGFERIKDFLLTAAHLGRLRPGKRVPSVRRMAQLTRLDRKTVHRAYVRLAQEGLLVTRRSSGTFMSDRGAAPQDSTELVRLLDRCFGEAEALGLAPPAFARVMTMLAGGGLAGMPVAVAECNHEQIGLIAREVERTLGVVAVPLWLRGSESSREGALRRVRAIVATNCHRDEVLALAAAHRLPVSFVAQDPGFADAFVGAAHRGPVLAIVKDAEFERGFRRLLAEIKVAPETAARITITGEHGGAAALRQLTPGAAVYVSPLVRGIALPPVHRRIVPSDYVHADSLRRLHVELAKRAAEIGWTPDAERAVRGTDADASPKCRRITRQAARPSVP